jgi:hypothetical protein
MLRRTFLLSLPLFLTATLSLQADDKGTPVTIDGLTSTAPAGWKEVKTSSNLRVKQFAVPKVEGDAADAELIIFFFGTGSGGGVKANVERWKGMFKPPEGKSIDDVAKTEEMTVGKVKVTYFDVSGTYLYRSRPGDPKVEERPNHRMLAVVFESENGPYFFRLVGPEKTVTHHKKGFDEWLKNFK